jgi:hypothetical protein
METQDKSTLRADLHCYGLIGFQPHWRNVQGHADSNVAVEIVRQARSESKQLDVLALTSMHDAAQGIVPGSVHDRFSQFQAELQDSMYKATPYGNDLLEIRCKAGNGHCKPLYVLNAQKVITRDTKNRDKRADILIVGGNHFPNNAATADLLTTSRALGYLAIATSDVAAETIESYAGDLDAMAHTGHNLRILGNNSAKWKAAQRVSLPCIAVSGAKLPENVGSAYTEFDIPMNLGSGKQLLHDIGQNLPTYRARAHRGYEPITDFIGTNLLFRKYTKSSIREKYGV